MPYQDLDLPRLRTVPYPEADIVKKASGYDFPTPTLIIATKGNRQVLRNSGIPRLVRLEKHFGKQAASTVIEYNLVVLSPGLDRNERNETLIHESAHSLSGFLRDYRVRFGVGDYFNGNDPLIWQKALANKALEEGFANYWETRARALTMGLNNKQVINFHNAEIEARASQIDPNALQDPSVAESATYPVGHMYVLLMIRNLEGILGKQEAIRAIANSDPENMEQIMSVPPKMLNLSWIQSARYRFRSVIYRP